LTDKPLAKANDIRQKIKVKKSLVGRAEHYYTKSKIAQFLLSGELCAGDKVLISGPTTGEQELVMKEMVVGGMVTDVAKAGDQITFELPFRVRLSDKMYKIL